MEFDNLGRRTCITDPSTGTTLFDYTVEGLLAASVDALNRTASYTYDELNRIDTMRITAGDIVESSVSYTYDAGGIPDGHSVGRLTQVTTDDGSQQFAYDALGNVAKVIHTLPGLNNTYEEKFTYSLLGRLTTRTFPDGEAQTQTYSPSGNIKTVQVGTQTY
ncbi:MAG: hypothetical protein GY757_37095, partial [bacterium]|nr:hypothetical protein [bacterium]